MKATGMNKTEIIDIFIKIRGFAITLKTHLIELTHVTGVFRHQQDVVVTNEHQVLCMLLFLVLYLHAVS